MRKMREKTTVVMLIAVFLVSTFAITVKAGPTDYFFTQDLLGEAGLVSGAGLGHESDNAVRLYIPGTPDINDDAKLRIPYTGTLAGLTTFSFWTKVTGTDGELHPYGSLNIDSDEDPDIDYVVVQWEVGSYPPTGVDEWIQTVWDDDTRIHVVSSHLGWGELPGFGQADAKTLGDLKLEIGWTDYEVTQVKVAVGMWAITYPLEGFVDDVVVNGLTYDFEPEPTPAPKRRRSERVYWELELESYNYGAIPHKLLVIRLDDTLFDEYYEVQVFIRGDGTILFSKIYGVFPHYDIICVYFPESIFTDTYTVFVYTDLGPVPYIVASRQGIEISMK